MSLLSFLNFWGKKPLPDHTHSIPTAINYYYDMITSYNGNARDVKKADKHMDGFINIFKGVVDPNKSKIREKHKAIVPGAFLNKRWDIATSNSALELKSIVLSKMGKCFSNRVEEAIGVAVDLKHGIKGMKLNYFKLNYFLVVENDSVEGGEDKEVKYQRKINKIVSFCRYIEKDLKLYDNVCCLVLDSNGNHKCVYSDFNTFVYKWRKGIQNGRT